jgi:AcrR family transcriptional regulator
MLRDIASLKKPLRADARRNRDAMLVAARKVFAEQGLDAPMDLIARTAGISRATQHRHFPTRDSLVRAIFDDNMETLERLARELEDRAGAYVELLLATVEILIRQRSFVELFDQRTVSDDVKRDIADRFLAIVAEPLRRAQEAGRVRADLRPDDTLLLLDMLGAAAHSPGPGRPADRARRGIALVLEAIDPAARLPLATAPSLD